MSDLCAGNKHVRWRGVAPGSIRGGRAVRRVSASWCGARGVVRGVRRVVRGVRCVVGVDQRINPWSPSLIRGI
jgi:hypothetical protein